MTTPSRNDQDEPVPEENASARSGKAGKTTTPTRSKAAGKTTPAKPKASDTTTTTRSRSTSKATDGQSKTADKVTPTQSKTKGKATPAQSKAAGTTPSTKPASPTDHPSPEAEATTTDDATVSGVEAGSEQAAEEILAFDVVFDDESGIAIIEDGETDEDTEDIIDDKAVDDEEDTSDGEDIANAAGRPQTDDDKKASDTTTKSRRTKHTDTESTDTAIPERMSIPMEESFETGHEDDVLLKAYPTFAFDHVTLIEKKSKRRLLDDVSWPFYEGSLTAISIHTADDEQRVALLGALSGFKRPDHGEVTLKSVSLNNYEPAELRGYRITVIPRLFDLRDDLDAVSNLVLAMDASERTFLKPKPRLARELLDTVGFEEPVESLPASQFTLVDRRRIGIARAMAVESTVTVLDEPTQDLDEAGRKAILDLLRGLAKSREPRRSVIMVTSSDDEIDAADRVIEV